MTRAERLVRLGPLDDGRRGEGRDGRKSDVLIRVGEEVDFAFDVDVEDRFMNVDGARAEQVENGHVLDAAREAGVDVVRASGAGLAPFLALGEVPFVDGYDNELGERLRGMSEHVVKD